MKLVGAISGAAVLLTLMADRLFSIEATAEVWLGMLGPVSMASLEWIATERVYKRSPELLTSLMLRLFIVKIIFFAGYVIAALSLVQIRPIPFAGSFVAFFLMILVVQALALHRLTSTSLDRAESTTVQ